MNEDTFTVQLMDTSERVHSLEKRTLKSFRHEDRSLMPAYDTNGVCDNADLDDVRGVPADAALGDTGAEEGRIAMTTVSDACRRSDSVSAAASTASAQVTRERLVNAAREPQQWLTYSGAYDGSRYSAARSDQPHERQAPRRCNGCFRRGVRGSHETTPLVIDGVMY